MRIKKAIKVLKSILDYVTPGDPPEEHDAIKLSIEALEAILLAREGSYASFKLLLPGETKTKPAHKTPLNQIMDKWARGSQL